MPVILVSEPELRGRPIPRLAMVEIYRQPQVCVAGLGHVWIAQGG
jgi:hypothetical protein